jgi:heat shock protein HslJ
MEQERQFLAALTSVAALRHEGQRLELRRADGALAVILLRLPTAAQ